jgi:hypothetical protein
VQVAAIRAGAPAHGSLLHLQGVHAIVRLAPAADTALISLRRAAVSVSSGRAFPLPLTHRRDSK